MRLPGDLREFIASLNSHRVEFMVVGGFALAYHGLPRYTGDLDLLVRPSLENAALIESVLIEFGFDTHRLTAQDFVNPESVVELGRSPNRIDLFTSITGVEFDEAWDSRVKSELDGVPVSFLSYECLIRNKRAIGRTRDIADLEALGAI